MHLLDDVPHCNELSCLLPNKQQLLLHCISSRVPVHEHKEVGEERGREGRGGEGGRRKKEVKEEVKEIAI